MCNTNMDIFSSTYDANINCFLQEYSVKHLVGLISATCQNNKKTRQRLIALAEEQRSSR